MEENMYACSTEVEEDTQEKKDAVIILSPAQLSDHCNLPSYLPTRGKKEVCPDGSNRQQEKLQRLHEQQDQLLREERVAKVNRVAIGEWNQSKQLVEVKVERGKFWQTMGYHCSGKKYLYPEEGLFLLEMNTMELRHGKVPISVQQAYELMIPYQFSLEHYQVCNGAETLRHGKVPISVQQAYELMIPYQFSLEHYQVYSHLMRLGYVTTRHKESDISDYEYRINLDQFRHRQKQAYKKVQGWFQQMSETTDVTQQYIESDSDSGRDIKGTKSTGSISFHGSGVSGKAVEGQRSSSSGDKAQLLPGSGVSSDSSPDNDDSSEYSDGPVEPQNKANSQTPSINLLEFHKKYYSDNSGASSSNNKSATNSNCETTPEKQGKRMIASIRKHSRKRKLKASNQDTSTDDQVEIKPKKKVRRSQMKVDSLKFKSQTEVDSQKIASNKAMVHQTSNNEDESGRLAEIPTKWHDVVMKEDQIETTEKLLSEKIDIHHVIAKTEPEKELDKNTLRFDSGKDSEYRRPSDRIIKELSLQKQTINKLDVGMEITSEKELDKNIDKTALRDDSGKDSESRRSSIGSIKDFSQQQKQTIIEDVAMVAMDTMSDKKLDKNTLRDDSGKDSVAMETMSDYSHTGKPEDYQKDEIKSKSSDLGTDLSSPSSLDVNIDDVLELLSPSSPRNNSILDDGKGGSKYTSWDFQQIMLPNLAQKQTVGLPQPEYLPDSIASALKGRQTEKDDNDEGQMEQGEDTVHTAQTDILQELVKVNQLLRRSSELMESTSLILGIENKEIKPTAAPPIGTNNIENVRRLFPAKPAASNWGEYKRIASSQDQIKGLTDVIQSPVTHLWQGEVQPLVKPSDAVSSSYLLHKLQIIQNANLTSEHVRWPYESSPCQECKIAFDVYQPDTGYKKSKPGLPGFQVVVSSVSDPVPDLATQAYLLQQSKPVKLLWAIVDTNGDIAFYSLQDVELPIDITAGW